MNCDFFFDCWDEDFGECGVVVFGGVVCFEFLVEGIVLVFELFVEVKYGKVFGVIGDGGEVEWLVCFDVVIV